MKQHLLRWCSAIKVTNDHGREQDRGNLDSAIFLPKEGTGDFNPFQDLALSLSLSLKKFHHGMKSNNKKNRVLLPLPPLAVHRGHSAPALGLGVKDLHGAEAVAAVVAANGVQPMYSNVIVVCSSS